MKNVCKKCGASLTEGAPFCPECGTKTDVQMATDNPSDTASVTLTQSFATSPSNQSTMKKVAIAAWCVTLIAIAAIVGFFFTGGDNASANIHDEIETIYSSHLVLATDSQGEKFAWHRYISIFEELKNLRQKNQELRMRAYGINVSKLNDADKKGVENLRGMLDVFDNYLLFMLRTFEEEDRNGEYSVAAKERKKEYEDAYSLYLTQKNAVEQYLHPESKGTK